MVNKRIMRSAQPAKEVFILFILHVWMNIWICWPVWTNAYIFPIFCELMHYLFLLSAINPITFIAISYATVLFHSICPFFFFPPLLYFPYNVCKTLVPYLGVWRISGKSIAWNISQL